ncbi:MAG TPA: CBS domain-containing protein [Verrucomicrobia bacterium]|nr:CBS domain-containing protein [Verrucomicrobiota bacterium]HOP97893.1 chloride channel protein [Verrucomicrobiota bacterium]HPU55786.1 chloride channel protein [Verrucomicrobiota bacterium]
MDSRTAATPSTPVCADAREPSRPRLADFSTDRRVLLLSAMGAVVGALGSVVAYALVRIIAVITHLAFYQRWSASPVEAAGHHLGYWVLAVPVSGALIIGLMARFGSEKIRGHGIPEALEAILLGRSRIEPRMAVLKPISAAVSIGTGGPFGAEGPIIMTGGAVGSIFAQQFHLSAAERKTLLVAGAAAGMSAIFATPVAAVLLAVELLLFEWKPRSFIPVAVAAIVASVLRVPLLGAGPVFPAPAHAVPSGEQLFFAAGVGVLAGFGSGLLTVLVYACEDLFHKLPLHWMWWPAIGAVFIGIGGIIEPRVLGMGYDTIHGLLRGEMAGAVLIGLMVAKALVWAIALGSGTSGGVLAPLLIMGGALGALVGERLPGHDTGFWALIGMAAMMGGTMRSPLTAMVFAVELTHDFNLLPALLIGSVAALGVTVLLMRRSILTEKLERRGHHVTREYSVDTFELARVGDVMEREVPCVPSTMTLAELSNLIDNGDSPVSRRQGTLIVEGERLAGIITRGDMVRALRRDPDGRMTVAEAGCIDLVVTYPDEPLHTALARMLGRNIGRLPVVERSAPTRVVGYLGRAAILSARMRLLEEEHRRERS